LVEGSRRVTEPKTKVGVIGAYGRMGSEACRAIDDADDLELVARIGSKDTLDALADAGAEVAVELTRPSAVMDNLRWCIEHRISVVCGTSGFDAERLDTLTGWVADSPRVGVLVVPNFSLGAVLMMRFAAQAAPYFESVEIIELHHPGKADAPSGTARRTAEQVAAARRTAGLPPAPDATTDALPGSRGAEIDGVPVHSVRLRGLVAHQEVLLGGAGETLTIRHDSTDRAGFMPGVLLGIRGVRRLPGLTVGLDSLLALDGG
jgi:4-hydroxy-tetrahydrodipicolinate reductase